MLMKFPSFDEFMSLNESAKFLNSAGLENFEQWILNESIDSTIRAKVLNMSNEEALEKAERIIQMCLLKINEHFPMFTPFLSIMPPIPRFGAGDAGPDGIGTMSTSGKDIYYDPKFVVITYEKGKIDFEAEMKNYKSEKITALKAARMGIRWPSDYACFIILHEIMHNSLKHFLREPVTSDYLDLRKIKNIWNLATDYEINQILKKDSGKLIKLFPGVVDAEEGPFAVPKDQVEFFTTSIAERIFWRLLKNVEAKIQEELGDEEQQKGEEGEDGEGEEGEGEGGEGKEGEDSEGEEGEDGEGEEGEGEGEGGEGGQPGEGDEGGQPGEGDEGGQPGEGGNESKVSLKPGEVIYDHTSGTYGRVTSVSGEDIDYEPISEEEARKTLS